MRRATGVALAASPLTAFVVAAGVLDVAASVLVVALVVAADALAPVAAFSGCVVAPPPSPMFTVSPSCLAMDSRTPAVLAATSILTFSVSNSTSGSPTATGSPTCFSQRPTVASTIDSPSAGTVISLDILTPLASLYCCVATALPFLLFALLRALAARWRKLPRRCAPAPAHGHPPALPRYWHAPGGQCNAAARGRRSAPAGVAPYSSMRPYCVAPLAARRPHAARDSWQ